MNRLIEILKQLIKNKSLHNGALFSLFSFINRGFSFLLLLILANYILPAEYGYLSLFSTIVMVLGYFIAMSTEGYLSLSFFKEGPNGIKQTFSCIFFTCIISTILATLSLTIFGEKISLKTSLPLHSLSIAICIVFFTVFFNLFLDYLRINKNVRSYGILSCGNALLNFFVSIILVKHLHQGWEGRINAQMICCILFGLLSLAFFIKKKYMTFPNKKHWKMMLLWGIPLIPHLATNFIRQGCDRYIVNYYHTIEDVGLFSFALNLSNIIIMVGVGFNQSNSVEIYSILGNTTIEPQKKQALLKHQKKSIFLINLICSIIILFSCLIFIPYALPQYSAAMKYLPVLALYAFLNCLYFLYTNFLFYFKETKHLMYITFGTSILHLIFSLIFTRYSLHFTCLVYTMSQFVIFILLKKHTNNLIKV